MRCNFVFSSFAVAATFLLLFPLGLRAAENSGPLTADERAAFLAELQPLQDRLAALRNAPNVSPDRWADAQIFVKGVVWAIDFGPVTDAKSRELVRSGLVRARERIEALIAGKVALGGAAWTQCARLHFRRR